LKKDFLLRLKESINISADKRINKLRIFDGNKRIITDYSREKERKRERKKERKKALKNQKRKIIIT